MASKRRSGRITKKEVKYFKEDSSDEEDEEVTLSILIYFNLQLFGPGLWIGIQKFSSIRIHNVIESGSNPGRRQIFQRY
jgi:hypothetical protein